MEHVIEDYIKIVDDNIITNILKKARKLHKKHVLNINSTFIGGGVEEILCSHVPLMNNVGIHAGWRVIHGCQDFYNITKKFHNGLQGEKVKLSKKEKELYLKINEIYSGYTHANHDYIIIHDPQPLPMAYYIKQDQPWIWRCIRESYVIGEDGFKLIDEFSNNDSSRCLLGTKDYVNADKFLVTKDKVLKIITNRGYELIGTKDHPILCWDKECVLKFKKLEDIQKGDYVVINREFPYLVENYPNINFEIDYFKAKIIPKLPSKITEKVARIIGYMIADGNFTNEGIEIANINNFIVDDIFKICYDLDLKPCVNGNHVFINSLIFKKWMYKLLDKPNRWIAKFKYIPKIILQSPKSIQSNCLRAYFNCDSTFKGHDFRTSTISERLSKQVHILLLNFGIISKRKIYSSKIWRVKVSGKNLKLLKDLIGYDKYDIVIKENNNTNIDIIPFLREHLGISKRKLNANNLSFDKFKYLMKNIDQDSISFSERRIFKIDSNMRDKLKKLEIGSLFFDKINSKKDLGEKEVYDFSISKRPYFWSNGFISHNCHIDLSDPNKELWNFIKPFIFHYNVVIVSREEYKKKDLPVEQRVISPAIDPLSPKNCVISNSKIKKYIKEMNIPMDKPIITQVSRMDKWKDPIGVLKIYKKVLEKIDCRLIYCFNLASDDPEGLDICNNFKEESGDLIEHGNIILIDKDDKSLVNVIQNISDVIIQKSIKEGFALTVCESLWKSKPVVASNVGGIPSQIINGENGYLVDPYDYDGFADRIVELLKNKKLGRQFGKKAKEYVRKNFLITRLLDNYLDLMLELKE